MRLTGAERPVSVGEAMFVKRIAGSACRTATDERGAALVIVLIALVGLTALAAAGMVATGSDLQIARNMDASTRAFYAADAGLQTYFGSNTDGTTGATYVNDSLTTVTVVPWKLTEIAGGRILYRVTSTAVYVQAPGDTASRSISRVAIFSDGSIEVPASFTAQPGCSSPVAQGRSRGRIGLRPAIRSVRIPQSLRSPA